MNDPSARSHASSFFPLPSFGTRDADVVGEMFARAGVGLDGAGPKDLVVHDPRFFSRFLRDGSLGLGETYMEGWWDVASLDGLMHALYRADLQRRFRNDPRVLLAKARAHVLDHGSRTAARDGVRHHYDLGNDLYTAMLDRRLVYTCAIWENATTLDEAQEVKMDILCRKLGLEPGMRVLDIGCGWGSFLAFAAERYGVTGVGVSISREQIALGRERCAGLPVELRFQDYRDLDERFDRIVTVGMFEHVGHKNHRTFMEVVHRCLADEGLYVLHTIGRPTTTAGGNNLFLSKYIFPNTTLPSPAHLGRAIDGLFLVEDWEAFGAHYDRTLMAWLENFERAWPTLAGRYDERFRRMWRFYLAACAGAFRARSIDLWQVVLGKRGRPSGYRRPARA